MSASYKIHSFGGDNEVVGMFNTRALGVLLVVNVLVQWLADIQAVTWPKDIKIE